MINAQNYKTVMITQPAAIVDNAAFTTAEIDTLGWSYAKITVAMGATDIGITTLKLQESDTSGSGFADVTGGSFASALPGATDDNKLYAFYVKLGGSRKRYLDVSITGGDGTTGTYLTAWVDLSRGGEFPNTAAERGNAGELFI